MSKYVSNRGFGKVCLKQEGKREEGNRSKDSRNQKFIFPFHYLCANFLGAISAHNRETGKANEQRIIKARMVGQS